MTQPRLAQPMWHQLPVERTLILGCGICAKTHDARAIGAYDVNGMILYRADDGSDHEWVAGVRVMLYTPEQRKEAKRQGIEIEPWDTH